MYKAEGSQPWFMTCEAGWELSWMASCVAGVATQVVLCKKCNNAQLLWAGSKGFSFPQCPAETACAPRWIHRQRLQAIQAAVLRDGMVPKCSHMDKNHVLNVSKARQESYWAKALFNPFTHFYSPFRASSSQNIEKTPSHMPRNVPITQVSKSNLAEEIL